MAGTDNTAVTLTVVAGLPYQRRFRILGGRKIWATRDLFEVRSHVRVRRLVTSQLLFDLTPFLKADYEADDIVVDLEMTGEDTRKAVKGYFDIIVSDVGSEDARALTIASGKVKVSTTVTAAGNG
jgi:hypothetical protein